VAYRWSIAGRAELIESGFSPTQIRSWLKSGRLTPVLRGVYSYGRDIESRNAAFKAALVAAGPGSALTGRSACEKWGLVKPSGTLPGVIQVARPYGQASIYDGQSKAMRNCRVDVVRRQLDPASIRRVDRLEAVSPVHALIEFAADASEREVRFAFLEACRLGFIKKREAMECFRALHGRPGAKKLRPLLTMWVPGLNRIKSVFEGRVLLDWIDRKYPLPEINVKVYGREVDQHWPKKDFVLELDGGAYHSDPVQRAIDLEKSRFLMARGKTVRRLTYGEYDADPVGSLDRIALELGFM